MQLKIIKPKELNAIAKITVHKTGKLGFSKGAMHILSLSINKYAKFGFDQDENFFIVICSESDAETFTIAKAGDYFYIAAKSLLEELEIDYKSDATIIFDIKKTEEASVFRLDKRIINK